MWRAVTPAATGAGATVDEAFKLAQHIFGDLLRGQNHD
jgi:hypothetical protein